MNSAAEVWRMVMNIIEQEMTVTTINTWFDDTVAVDITDDCLTVYSPSEYKRGIIINRYTPYLKKALYEVFSMDMDIKIVDHLPQDPQPTAHVPDIIQLNTDYNFDNFVVGRSNKYAHAAAQSVAENPGKEYNPLFIYGESGLGKTHLLFAIANEVRRNHPDYNIIYIKGDDFINEHVEAIRNKTTAEFRAKYRGCDLFLVDDIQFIAKMDNVQTEFFHTFDTLSSYGKQTVITSDRPPKDMPTLTDRLRTRFEWGLLTEVTRPDHETRMAIVKSKCIRSGISLPDDVIDYIAESITNNVRQLEGAVNKIASQTKLMGTEINMTSVSSTIRDLYKDSTERMPTMPLIIQETCKYFGVEEKVLKGRSRSADVKNPRHIAMYLIRQMTDISFEAIGAEFNRDHTSVISGVNRIAKVATLPGDISDAVRDITANVNYILEK